MTIIVVFLLSVFFRFETKVRNTNDLPEERTSK